MKTFMIAAVTADGFIAKQSIHPTSWTSPEDKQHFRKLTKAAGVTIMGANTYKTLNRAFEERRTIVYTHQPQEITAKGVETTAEPPRDLLTRLASEGHTTVAIIGGATIFRQFLQAGAVDELYLTIEPVLWGQGLTLLDQDCRIALELLDITRLNASSILVHYRVLHN
jgi:dihydrofolate reductase